MPHGLYYNNNNIIITLTLTLAIAYVSYQVDLEASYSPDTTKSDSYF